MFGTEIFLPTLFAKFKLILSEKPETIFCKYPALMFAVFPSDPFYKA
jgi:hypothetical protein